MSFDALAAALLYADCQLPWAVAPRGVRKRYRVLAKVAIEWRERTEKLATPLLNEELIALASTLTPDDLANGWNQTPAGLYGLPTVTVPLSVERQRKAAQRLRQYPEVDAWSAIFAAIGQSRFLRGLGNSKGPHANWRCTFDWLIANDTNAAKVLEGQYADKRGAR